MFTQSIVASDSIMKDLTGITEVQYLKLLGLVFCIWLVAVVMGRL